MKKHIKNFIILLATVALVIVAINKIISLLNRRRDNLGVEDGYFYNWKYGNIFYIKKGSGKPLLLIHDLNVYSSAYEWNAVIDKLAENHTVYAIDLLGCGRSDKPNLTYTNYLYVQLITDFVKNIVKKPVDVICTGDSVSFTVMTCKMESDVIDKIISVNPADMYDLSRSPNKKKNMVKALIDVPVIGTFAYNLRATRFRIEDKFFYEYFSKPENVTPEMIDTYYQAAHLGDGAGRYLLSSMKGSYTNINIATAIKNVDNSILMIRGEDAIMMDDIVEDYLRFNPAIETAEIKGTAQLPQLERPDAFVELINIFCA